MLRYKSSLVYNQLLTAHIMSKIIFMKYLPPVRPKMIPKLKMPRIYWNLTRDISNIPISVFMSKIIFIKYLPTAWPKLVPKLKVLRIYWNLAHWIFRICQSRFWCQKSFLSNRYNLLGPNWSQNWKFVISNIPNSILMSKNIF